MTVKQTDTLNVVPNVISIQTSRIICGLQFCPICSASLKNETERTEMMEKFATMREKIRSQTSRTVSSDNMKHAPPARPFPKELQSRLVAHQQRNHVEAKQQGMWFVTLAISNFNFKV